MIFNVLLFKNANYQQINYIERALFYDTHERKKIISVLQRKSLERQYLWKIKTNTKNPQLGLVYSAKHFAMYCGNATIDQHFWYKRFKIFVNDALSLCKPAKQF